jgi:Protein of unknown function (DUF2933)
MNTVQNDKPSSSSEVPLRRNPLVIAALMIALIGVFYVLREHWGHIAGYWPYLILLGCPLMHLFHGHGHHHHHKHSGHEKPEDKQTPIQ